MAKESAGILLFRMQKTSLEVLLAHPGGPFWKNKDIGAWTIPKGEIGEGEDKLQAALREAREELGVTVTGDHTVALSPVKLKSKKVIYAWAIEMDVDVTDIHSNTFDLEWPPGSGVMKAFPEIDRAEWFSVGEGLEKINAGQRPLIEELIQKLLP